MDNMTRAGKILILQLYDKLLSILICDNQILSIQLQRENDFAVGNVYLGKVQNISKNIGAAFVDIGKCLTFLSMNESREAIVTNRQPDGTLKINDEVLVQIVKEPIKTKLAGVTTRISLSGNYAAVGMKGVSLQPHSERKTKADGMTHVPQKTEPGPLVSSKLNKSQHNRFRRIEELCRLSENYQVIVRTNAGKLTDDSVLIAEAGMLSEKLTTILQTAGQRTCYSCLYRGKPDYLTFVQNAYRTEFEEVITDIPEVYENLAEACAKADIPLRFYDDKMLPLYKLYSIESRVKELLDKRVWLKSGGYLIIEPTESLISIDVNSGKCETGRQKEETFFKINMEAAEMIARQIRARNLSGMILVDFINLNKKEHEEQLIEYMKSLLKKDSVPANVVDITGLGLMEITRKKINQSFAEQMNNRPEIFSTKM